MPDQSSSAPPSSPRPSPLFIPELFRYIAFYLLCDESRGVEQQMDPCCTGEAQERHKVVQSQTQEGHIPAEHQVSKRLRQRSPASTLVICAQVCRSWSEQLLPLLWHTISLDQYGRPRSLFLSELSSRLAPNFGPTLLKPLWSIPNTRYSRTSLSDSMALPFSTSSTLHGPFEPEQQSTRLYPCVDAADIMSTSPWPSPTFQQSYCSSAPSNPLLARDTSGAQSHISAGLDSNGNLIRRLYLYNTQLAHIFDHPNISELTDFICILMPSMQSLVHVEDILARNINHRLQRLKMGRSSGRRRSKDPSYSRDINNSEPGRSLRGLLHHKRSNRVYSSDTGSSGHRSRPTRDRRHRSRISHQSPQRSSSSQRAHQGSNSFAESDDPPCKQHLQDNRNYEYKAQSLDQGNPHVTFSRHPQPYMGSSFPNASEKDMETDDPGVQLDSRDDGTSAIMNSLLRGIQSHGAQPSFLTHLSLLQYEFVMGDWIRMMQMMPSLHDLDLDIISGVLSCPGVARIPSNNSIRRDSHRRRHRRRSSRFQYTRRHNPSSSVQQPTVTGRENDTSQLNLTSNSKDDDLDHASLGVYDSDITGCVDSDWSSLDSEDGTLRSIRHQLEQQHLNEKYHDMTNAPPSDSQFPSVRSLTFRGVKVLPELLRYLPNLECLALKDPTYGDSSAAWSEPTKFPTPSPFLDLASVISGRCPRLCRLVLTESLAQNNPQWSHHIPLLLRAIPQLLHFTASTRLVSQSQEIVAALLQYHGVHLRSFLVHDGTKSLHHQQPQVSQQPQDTYFGPQGNPYYHPLYEEQYGLPQDPQQVTLHQLCLQVLETCPSLQVYDCKILLPIKDVMTSIPSWACRCHLAVLRLELQELTGAGTLAGDEEEVLEMFIKTLFLRARSSPPRAAAETGTEPWSGPEDLTPATRLSESFARSLSITSSSSSTSTLTSMLTPPTSISSSGTPEVALKSDHGPFQATSYHDQQPQHRRQAQTTHSGETTLHNTSMASFMSSFANCHIRAAGRLMALQFLIEHHLVMMPNLGRFFLGNKMFKLSPKPLLQ